MDYEQNITYRTCKPQKASSLNDISVSNSSIFDTTMMSLPNTSLNESHIIQELNEKVNSLTIQLASAHQEIENLNTENFRLKTDLNKSLKVAETLKKISLESPCVTPISGSNKKRNKNKPTPKRLPTDSQIDFNEKIAKDTEETKFYVTNSLVNSSVQMREYDASLNINENNITEVPATLGNCSIITESTFEKMPHTQTIINIGKDVTTPPELTEHNGSDVVYIEKIINEDTKDENIKHKIVVIADNQGRQIQHTLQLLVGDRFQVTCFWKSEATLQDVLTSECKEITSLTHNDYLIVLGGVNERSPCIFKTCVSHFLCCTRNTNVFFCEIPYNQYLREDKLNYELKFLCSKFANVKYIDMDFSRYMPYRRFFARHVCRTLHRVLLNSEYAKKYMDYVEKTNRINALLVDKTTQTDSFSENIETTQSSLTKTESPTPSTSFFRV